MKYIDKIDNKASKIGSVNTIKLVNDIVIRYNTDYDGFGYMLEKENVKIEK